ncbi:MAG TPA: hypothetical protein PK544_13400, partial [Spirochaetota bacterium]|nr:hypothetical protein [Spirochaetota bacterium]
MRDIIKTSASLTAVLICCVLAAGCSKSIPAEVEPNNTFNTAMKLEDNGAVTGYFNSADDVDC